MSVNLPWIHGRWLRGNAKAHMHRELGVFLFVCVGGFWPPKNRPRGEGLTGEREQYHGILAVTRRTLRQGPPHTAIRRAVSEPAH